jgi:hypothetical protein
MAQRGDILADNSEVSVSMRSNTQAGCPTGRRPSNCQIWWGGLGGMTRRQAIAEPGCLVLSVPGWPSLKAIRGNRGANL